MACLWHLILTCCYYYCCRLFTWMHAPDHCPDIVATLEILVTMKFGELHLVFSHSPSLSNFKILLFSRDFQQTLRHSQVRFCGCIWTDICWSSIEYWGRKERGIAETNQCSSQDYSFGFCTSPPQWHLRIHLMWRLMRRRVHSFSTTLVLSWEHCFETRGEMPTLQIWPVEGCLKVCTEKVMKKNTANQFEGSDL